jgi:hypothetical protein
MGIYVKRGDGSAGSARVCQVRGPRYRRAPGAQSDYWFLSTKDSHHAPTLLALWVPSSGGALKIEGLAWFSNQAIMQCIIEKNSYILGPTRKYPRICQKESPPMPNLTLFGTNLRQSIPNGLEALPNLFAKKLEAPQFEVEPQCDSDSRYVSFCQLLGYQREELVGKRYDDLTAPNTNDIPTVFGLFQKLGYIHAWSVAAR